MRWTTPIAIVLLMTTVVNADDANRWAGWQTPADGQSNGIDVSFVPVSPNNCRKPWVGLQPRFKNRYQEHVAGRLKIDHESTDGPRTATPAFDLQADETKLLADTSFCHDPKRPLAVAIAEFRFPDRDAEQQRLAAQKAAAEKAAAERRVAAKAAADKAVAEQRAIEEARRKESTTQNQHSDAEHVREQQARRDSQLREEQNQRDVEAAAIQYRQQQQLAAEQAASKQVVRGGLLPEQLRNGEVTVHAPIGYQRISYGTSEDSGVALGVRGELRLFKWWGAGATTATPSARAEPRAAIGFEFGIGAGLATVTDALETRATPEQTNLVTGHVHARLWRGSIAAGLFGHWTRYSRDPGGGAASEVHDLFALGPEVAFGIAASRLLTIELGGRVGAVASGSGLTVSATQDLYMAAHAIAGFNYIYAGAIATRYHELSSGGIPRSWSAMAVLGVRIPF